MSFNKFFFLILAIIALETPAGASGVITVSGKLVSITSTEYVVETATQVYHISKQAVLYQQAEKMERTEVPVSLTIPFNAVLSVEAKKKSS